MALARYANRRDENEPGIVADLRQIGASVCLLDVPCDLLVGYRGTNYLIEVKRPLGPQGGSSGRELTQGQDAFAATWRGQFRVARSSDEALRIIGAGQPTGGAR